MQYSIDLSKIIIRPQNYRVELYEDIAMMIRTLYEHHIDHTYLEMQLNMTTNDILNCNFTHEQYLSLINLYFATTNKRKNII
jgi:hypothetical protein